MARRGPRGSREDGARKGLHINLVAIKACKKQMTTEGGPVASVVDTDSVDTVSRYKRWSNTVHDYVAVDLFRYVQFINREEDVMFGSGIQKVVCKACRIPENEQLDFWTSVGCAKVEEVLRRKRQTVTTSFRNQFESK
jgi:hypothetical protein